MDYVKGFFGLGTSQVGVSSRPTRATMNSSPPHLSPPEFPTQPTLPATEQHDVDMAVQPENAKDPGVNAPVSPASPVHASLEHAASVQQAAAIGGATLAGPDGLDSTVPGDLGGGLGRDITNSGPGGHGLDGLSSGGECG